MLVSVTDNRFRTIANGGHVADAEGDDIRPYTDTTLGTAITGYEKVFYDGTNGILEMWVKVTSLTSSSTPIYLGYGDTTLTADASSTTTWSNGYISVYHLKDGTTLSGVDSLAAHNGTLTNTPTAVAGQIDGAGSFASASSQYVQLGASVNGYCYSAWIKPTSFPGALNMIVGKNGTGTQGIAIFYITSGSKLVYNAGNGQVTSTGNISTGTWTYVTGQLETGSQTSTIYINAGSRQTGTNVSSSITGTNSTQIASDQAGGGRYWNGPIDEVHIYTTERSQDWITTEYNNQVAPGTFETLDSEVAVTTSQRAWFMFFPR